MSSNSDLIATQQIIKFMESVKEHADQMLDTLPLAYGVVQPDGRALKGNVAFSALLETAEDLLLGRSFADLFTPENWLRFKELMVSATPFELPISQGSAARDYWWFVSPLQYTRAKSEPLFAILGQDITELKRLNRENGRMESELSIARAVQASLFPSMQASLLRCDIAAYYSPASECSGDWCYYHAVGDKLFFWIADVTGHGAPAALITSAIRGAVSILETDRTLTPATAARHLNRAVHAVSGQDRNASMFVGSLDPSTGLLTYCVAAHAHTLVVPAKTPKKIRDLVPLDLTATYLLGWDLEAKFTECTYQLAPGDTVYLYTDGIIDAANPSGERWEYRRMMESLLKGAAKFESVHERLNFVVQSVEKFRLGEPVDDDVTMMMVRWR